MTLINWTNLTRLKSVSTVLVRGFLMPLGVCLVVSCGVDWFEFRRQAQKLEPLVKRHAPKSDVVVACGTNYVLYSRGDKDWAYLAMFLRDKPTTWKKVHKAAEVCPNIMFYTTPDMMTWIFLDKDDRIVGFEVGAQ